MHATRARVDTQRLDGRKVEVCKSLQNASTSKGGKVIQCVPFGCAVLTPKNNDSILVEGCLYSDSTFVLMSTRDCSGDGVTGDDGGYGYVTGDKIITLVKLF